MSVLNLSAISWVQINHEAQHTSFYIKEKWQIIQHIWVVMAATVHFCTDMWCETVIHTVFWYQRCKHCSTFFCPFQTCPINCSTLIFTFPVSNTQQLNITTVTTFPTLMMNGKTNNCHSSDMEVTRSLELIFTS